MIVGQRYGKWLLIQFPRLQTLLRDRQCEDAEVDLAVAQALEQRLGLMLVQHEPEMRQGIAYAAA